MSEPFGTILEKGSFGSPVSPSQIRIFKCYEVKTAEVFVKYQKDSLSGQMNLVTVGKAKVYCACLWKHPLGYTSLDNLYSDWVWDTFPDGVTSLDFSGVTSGSRKSGSYTYFESQSDICCEPCAWWNLTPYEAGEELNRNPQCMCQDVTDPEEVTWRTTGPASPEGDAGDERDIKADIKKALDQLGDCQCGPIDAGFKLRPGEGLA